MSRSRRRFLLIATAALAAAPLAALGLFAPAGAEEQPVSLPAPAVDPAQSGPQTAVFAGGCFWGVQGVFEHVRGVRQALSGYAGGPAKAASYELVSTGATGHAESVKVTYDPAVVSYGTLLRVFFSVAHDPTQVNRQGPDHGTQYRSEIFYTSPAQKEVADAYIAQLSATHSFARPIATKLEPLQGFYAAEAYHQDFMVHHPNHPYIVFNDLPKVETLKQIFPALYRADPVLSGSGT
ncbi:MAG: peptide-methionine (S)-S-oxide reductase MsrA [Acidisphaera sp.]|nr:peptide-methionine (S)-S-oxide reductase MsrA [Acidisphaera sp.]